MIRLLRDDLAPCRGQRVTLMAFTVMTSAPMIATSSVGTRTEVLRELSAGRVGGAIAGAV